MVKNLDRGPQQSPFTTAVKSLSAYVDATCAGFEKKINEMTLSNCVTMEIRDYYSSFKL